MSQPENRPDRSSKARALARIKDPREIAAEQAAKDQEADIEARAKALIASEEFQDLLKIARARRSGEDVSKIGKKSAYTPEVMERICEGVARGFFFKDAVANAGVSQSAAYEWLSEHAEFAEALTRAEALDRMNGVATLKAHGRTDWRSEAHRLKIRYPHDMSEVQRVDLTGKVAHFHLGAEQASTLSTAWQRLTATQAQVTDVQTTTPESSE